MRLRRVLPAVYADTARISLVSSWLASVLRGALAPLDISDVCGMNLWDVAARRYSEPLLALAADLRAKLGDPVVDGGALLGPLAPYFVARYGFSPDCQVVPFTGDNPATILALPLRPLDAIVSLGTSTTFLMNTPAYRPDGDLHFFHHPTTPDHYMFMLCYKNGGLTREKIRDALAAPDGGDGGGGGAWDAFNRAVLETPPLGVGAPGDRAKLGLYFGLRETVPNIGAGTWRFTCDPGGGGGLARAAAPWPSRRRCRCACAHAPSSPPRAPASPPSRAASTSSAAAAPTRPSRASWATSWAAPTRPCGPASAAPARPSTSSSPRAGATAPPSGASPTASVPRCIAPTATSWAPLPRWSSRSLPRTRGIEQGRWCPFPNVNCSYVNAFVRTRE